MQKPFEHNFKTIFGVIDVNGITGFTQCLNEVYKYINEKTERNPDKRFIDSVDLLEKIIATNEELKLLQIEANEDLENTLKNLTLTQAQKIYP